MKTDIIKEKVILTKEQETLLIPLYAKAQNNPLFLDEKAQQILQNVDYNFQLLKIPQKTEVTLRLRARQIDIFTQDFITQNPNALVLHLGCGLDSRCQRVPRAQSLWVDLDMPDVIELRRKFYPEPPTYRLIASSVTEPAWFKQVSGEGRPVFIIAEGLLMYLSETDVRALVLRLHQKFPGAHLVFDAFSLYTVSRIQAHPSISKTGATILWGIDEPQIIENWAPGIKLKEKWFFSQFTELNRLGWFYHWMFRLTGPFKTVQRAQRLLYYTL
jgi:O-methyltransferase involved in polyketide biosynthesis